MIQRFSILAMILLSALTVFSQNRINCDTNLVVGQNLVVNGDFEDGDFGFSIPGFRSWNKLSSLPEYSVAGDYWVSNNTKRFNNAFTGAPNSGDNYLMIDGVCNAGSIVWEQEVNIAKNTRYYFEVNIASVYNISTAELKFEIDGELLNGNIIAPSTPGQWVSFVDSSWFSAEREGSVKIRIRNDQTLNCEDGNDFALDNISFTAGCFFGSPGEVPYLGEDRSICGTDGTITLTPDVPSGNIYKYLWSTDEETSSITITKPGRYSVCMTTNGSCVKSDVIRINDLFEISLDGDKAVCKEVKDTLTVDHVGPLVSYKWFRNDALIPTATTQTYIPTNAGTYRVEVTDAVGKCGTKIDDMTLSIGSFTVDLGEDKELCKPGNATITANYEGSNYEWYLNGNRLGQFNTQSITVNQTGTYKVLVSDPICPTVEAEVNVTSETFSAVNANFCPDDSKSVQLAIKNATSDPSSYVWYSDKELTTQVGTGLTFNTPSDLTSTTTYYVKDTSLFSGRVGPLSSTGGGYGINETSSVNNNPDQDNRLWVDIFNNIIVDSVLVYPLAWNDGIMNVGMSFLDATTKQVVAEKTVQINVTNNGGNPTNGVYLPIKLAVPAGSYIVQVKGGTELGGIRYQDNSSFTWPYSDENGLVIIKGASTATGFYTNNNYYAFFDWHFSTGAVCDPVEVQAVFDPVFCSNCQSPTNIDIDTTGVLKCAGSSVAIDATIEGGTGTWTYSWTKNGNLLTDTTASIVVNFGDEGVYKVTVRDSASPSICYLASQNISIELSDIIPTVSLDINLESPICLASDVTLSVLSTSGFNPAPVDGEYVWKINGNIDNSSSNASITKKLNAGDFIEVSVSGKDACDSEASAKDTLTIKAIPAITPIVSISSVEACSGDNVAVKATLTPSSLLPNASFEWFIGSVSQTTESNGEFSSIFNDADSLSIVVSISGDACLNVTKDTSFTKAKISSSLTPSISILSDKNDICENSLPIVFRVDNSQNEGTTPSYKWFINNAEVPNATKDTLSSSTVKNGDKVKLELTSSLTCVTTVSTESNEIELLIKPMVDLRIELNKTNFELCSTETLSIEAILTPSGTSGTYQWKRNGSNVGNNSSTINLSLFNDGDEISVEFTPSIDCPTTSVVSPVTNASVSIIVPIVSIGEIFDLNWCLGKENGFKVTDYNFAGDSPSFEWFVNGISTGIKLDSLLKSDFVEGDSVSVLMTPSAPKAICPTDTAYAIVEALELPKVASISLTDSSICAGTIFNSTIDTINGGANASLIYYVNGVETTNSNGISGLSEGDIVKVILTSSIYCIENSVVSDSISIHAIDSPLALINPDNIEIFNYEAVVLDASTSESVNSSYLWESNDVSLYADIATRDGNTLTFTPKDLKTEWYFTVSKTEEGTTCSSKDTAIVIVNIEIEVPNAFSPNGDNINDKFLIDKLASLDEFNLKIFNKWGSLIFESSEADKLWDGTRDGKDLPVATYFYILEYKIGGESKTLNDYISLIR